MIDIKKADLPSKDTLNNTNNAQDSQSKTDLVPAQAAALVQVPGLVAEEARQTDDAHQVADNEGAAGTVAEVAEPFGQDVVGLAGLGSGLLLGELCLGASLLLGLLGLFLVLDARSLGLGLDVLLPKVGRDGPHGGCVNVNQRGGAGALRGLDLRRGRSGSLERFTMVSSCRSTLSRSKGSEAAGSFREPSTTAPYAR